MQAVEQTKQKVEKKQKKGGVLTCNVHCFIYEGSARHNGDKLPFDNVK